MIFCDFQPTRYLLNYPRGGGMVQPHAAKKTASWTSQRLSKCPQQVEVERGEKVRG